MLPTLVSGRPKSTFVQQLQSITGISRILHSSDLLLVFLPKQHNTDGVLHTKPPVALNADLTGPLLQEDVRISIPVQETKAPGTCTFKGALETSSDSNQVLSTDQCRETEDHDPKFPFHQQAGCLQPGISRCGPGADSVLSALALAPNQGRFKTVMRSGAVPGLVPTISRLVSTNPGAALDNTMQSV